ncbi:MULTISPECIES: phage holin family protein [unclassified Curtobacterium]|uniref:phage holin family protein n=1 Tax=unclassified Curtobacterium TaxID=257496 RepID=UPI000D94B1DA|nr:MULTISPECIES: phage holin family protein [unclassified Curtobacterium]PYY36551.1 phage holin family protein [Curtobacterium sp. MCBD17_030]PZE37026.1 phage holin family protein [Curtobacterium sp. MCPF17_031]PZF15619.1 phage holin family protein [Curtobacterium sp. MCPF17_011]
MTDTRDRKSRSLFGLVKELPDLVKDLVKGEISLLKAEMIGKAKVFGVAAGILIAALVIVLYAIGVLLTAAVMGLATVMPAWLAALLLAVLMLIVAGILGLVGWKRLKKGLPIAPKRTIASVKNDVNAVKGLGWKPTPETQRGARKPDVDGRF